MKREEHEGGHDREALVEQHREASRMFDERPSPSVRTRVMAAADDARGLHRARAMREARTGWRKLLEPRAAIAFVMVAVLAGLVASRTWDRIDLGESRRNDVASVSNLSAQAPAPPATTTPAAPAATSRSPGAMIASADTHAAAERERTADRRTFSRDRGEPASRPSAAAKRVPPAERSEVSTLSTPASSGEIAAAPVARADAAAPREPAAPPSRDGRVPHEADDASTTAAAAVPSTANAGALFASRAKSTADASTPDAWLARIVQLRRVGDDAAADAELARFRQRWPDVRVPDEAIERLPGR